MSIPQNQKLCWCWLFKFICKWKTFLAGQNVVLKIVSEFLSSFFRIPKSSCLFCELDTFIDDIIVLTCKILELVCTKWLCWFHWILCLCQKIISLIEGVRHTRKTSDDFVEYDGVECPNQIRRRTMTPDYGTDNPMPFLNGMLERADRQSSNSSSGGLATPPMPKVKDMNLSSNSPRAQPPPIPASPIGHKHSPNMNYYKHTGKWKKIFNTTFSQFWFDSQYHKFIIFKI